MGTSKRERQKAGHQARLHAERSAMARYRRRRRITLTAMAVGGVVVVAALFVLLSRSGTSSTATATSSTSTSTTAAALESALGKPCVAFDDTLPPGAPEVPVPVGDPPTSLTTDDLTVGSGTPAALGDQITVQYIGVSCSTGKIFDSSYTRGQPATFVLNEGSLIEGWTTGIPGMQPGGRRVLVVPPSLGYGSTGNATIAPDETLIFVVDLASAAPATTTTTLATGTTG
jgi:peptidylprolyl isomerase